MGRPVDLSIIAHIVRARTQALPSAPVNSTKSVEARSPGRFADPGSGGDDIAFVGGAQVIDLVPDHDPEISGIVLGRGDRPPVGDRDILYPLHPDRIVDVAELVDVFGMSGEGHFEDRPLDHLTSPG